MGSRLVTSRSYRNLKCAPLPVYRSAVYIRQFQTPLKGNSSSPGPRTHQSQSAVQQILGEVQPRDRPQEVYNCSSSCSSKLSVDQAFLPSGAQE